MTLVAVINKGDIYLIMVWLFIYARVTPSERSAFHIHTFLCATFLLNFQSWSRVISLYIRYMHINIYTHFPNIQLFWYTTALP